MTRKKELTIEELLNDEQLLSVIEELSVEYECMNITKEQLSDYMKNIVSEKISMCPSAYLHYYTSFFRNLFVLHLNEMVGRKFKENKKTSVVVGHYINNHFRKGKNHWEDLKRMEKICNFLTEIDCTLETYTCIELVKENEIVKNALKSIIDGNLKSVIKDELEKITNCDNLLTLMEAYTMVYKVNEIGDKEDDIDLTKFSNMLKMDYTDMETLDSVKMYLSAIHIPLLTEEEERKIATQVIQGNEKAKKIFIEHNLRLVVNIAKKFIGCGIDFLDLIQEGNIGLMKAVEKYDVTKELKFSTFAVPWIKREIRLMLPRQSRSISLPSEFHKMIHNYQKMENLLTQKLKRKPIPEEIAEALKISFEQAYELQKWQDNMISTSTKISEELEIEDTLENEGELIEDTIITNDFQMEINRLLSDCNLSAQDIEVLKARYGLDNENPMGLKEIGNMFGVKHQRIEQRLSRAIKDLRNSSQIQNFTIYTQNPEQSMRNLESYRIGYKIDEIATKLKACQNGKNVSFVRGKRILFESDYKKIVEILKYNGYESLIQQLGEQETVIVSLHMGYIKDFAFSNKAIAILLGISEEKVADALTCYQNNFIEVKKQEKVYQKIG